MHLAVWNIQFTISLGQLLWRICAIGQAVFLVLLTLAVCNDYEDVVGGNWVELVGVVSALLYTVVRLVLYGLVVMSFWSLPADAYEEVSWLEFIPQWS